MHSEMSWSTFLGGGVTGARNLEISEAKFWPKNLCVVLPSHHQMFVFLGECVPVRITNGRNSFGGPRPNKGWCNLDKYDGVIEEEEEDIQPPIRFCLHEVVNSWLLGMSRRGCHGGNVDGHAKLRAKQRIQQPSQPRGHPQATSPTCVSRVTWGPSQIVLIPDQSKGSHGGSHKGSRQGSHQGMSNGSHKELTKDWRQSVEI